MTSTPEYVPFKITSVVESEVGAPRNDGSRGSGLYAVPFAVSRRLTQSEQEALVHAWDNPPSWSTMHRFGTARCTSDRFILTMTTIEEVRDVHQKLLPAIVERANDLVSAQVRAEAADAEQKSSAAEDHRRSVTEAVKDIQFDH